MLSSFYRMPICLLDFGREGLEMVLLESLRVSVVIPIFNRSSDLRRLLVALRQQSLLSERFEILICDDGSTEDIEAVVNEFRSEDSPQIRYLRQSNQGPGSARNLGLAHAGAKIVAFTDSDCLPNPDWLVELTRPIEESTFGMTGGLVDFRTAEHLSGRCVNFLMSSMLGAGGARDPRSLVHMKYFPRGTNAAVLRDVALAAGGFPIHRHGEDIEFSDRVLQQGVKIGFVQSAVIVHNERRTMRQVWWEAFRKGAARIRLAKVRGVHQWIHRLPAILVLGLTASVMMGLAFPSLSMLAAIPAMAYGGVLLLLGIHVGLVLREVAAALATPIYAALMHLGYGCGYLVAAIAAGSRAGAYCEPQTAPSDTRLDSVSSAERIAEDGRHGSAPSEIKV